MLTFRFSATTQGAVAILGLALASANPHFALLLEGEVAVTFAGMQMISMLSVNRLLSMQATVVPCGAGISILSLNTGRVFCLSGSHSGVLPLSTGPHATFHCILLFLQYVRLNRLSLLGEHHLDRRQLDLAWVLKDVPGGSSLNSHWFGLW